MYMYTYVILYLESISCHDHLQTWQDISVSSVSKTVIPKVPGHRTNALASGRFDWVWVNTYRYMFSGMNIHLPAILGFTRYQGFDPSPDRFIAASKTTVVVWKVQKVVYDWNQLIFFISCPILRIPDTDCIRTFQIFPNEKSDQNLPSIHESTILLG